MKFIFKFVIVKKKENTPLNFIKLTLLVLQLNIKYSFEQ